MKVNVIADQQECGSFKYFVALGESAPWQADDKDCFECSSKDEAFRIKEMIERHHKAG